MDYSRDKICEKILLNRNKLSLRLYLIHKKGFCVDEQYPSLLQLVLLKNVRGGEGVQLARQPPLCKSLETQQSGDTIWSAVDDYSAYYS